MERIKRQRKFKRELMISVMKKKKERRRKRRSSFNDPFGSTSNLDSGRIVTAFCIHGDVSITSLGEEGTG